MDRYCFENVIENITHAKRAIIESDSWKERDFSMEFLDTGEYILFFLLDIVQVFDSFLEDFLEILKAPNEKGLHSISVGFPDDSELGKLEKMSIYFRSLEPDMFRYDGRWLSSELVEREEDIDFFLWESEFLEK
jgi:hypothetical protein